MYVFRHIIFANIYDNIKNLIYNICVFFGKRTWHTFKILRIAIHGYSSQKCYLFCCHRSSLPIDWATRAHKFSSMVKSVFWCAWSGLKIINPTFEWWPALYLTWSCPYVSQIRTQYILCSPGLPNQRPSQSCWAYSCWVVTSVAVVTWNHEFPMAFDNRKQTGFKKQNMRIHDNFSEGGNVNCRPMRPVSCASCLTFFLHDAV